LQIGHFGGQAEGSCYCIFDGHGSYGGKAAAFVVRELPSLLDSRLRVHFQDSKGSEVWTRGRAWLAVWHVCDFLTWPCRTRCGFWEGKQL
jgi:hypothetical protein